MKPNQIIKSVCGIVSAGVILLSSTSVYGQGRGMPVEARKTIHGLFDSHAKFERVVKVTEDGYVSRTTSEDPRAAALLKAHVKQMEARLKKGMGVRRWDPAYNEFGRHYQNISIKIKPIEKGIEVVAVGKTEMAKEIARNHASIVSKFVENGWSEHDVRHPSVASGKAIIELETGPQKSCCANGCQSSEASCASEGACCRSKE